jgi:hypothetical protein
MCSCTPCPLPRSLPAQPPQAPHAHRQEPERQPARHRGINGVRSLLCVVSTGASHRLAPTLPLSFRCGCGRGRNPLRTRPKFAPSGSAVVGARRCLARDAIHHIRCGPTHRHHHRNVTRKTAGPTLPTVPPCPPAPRASHRLARTQRHRGIRAPVATPHPVKVGTSHSAPNGGGW